MREKIFMYVIVLTLMIQGACRKVERNVLDYYPVVATRPATVQADGSVIITAEILSEGADPVKYAGFCMDTLPEPKMLSNQQTVEIISGNTFQTTYNKFKPFTRYYFRSFAANANGYVYGNTIALDNIQIDSSIFNCRPAGDTLKLMRTGKTIVSRFKTLNAPSQGGNAWHVEAEAGDYSLTFTFYNYPAQGIYTTAESDDLRGQYVKVEFNGPATGFGTITIDRGTSFYVRSLDANRLEYSFCGAKFTDGTDYTLEARFVSPAQ